jgi:hypothetical protein
MIGFVKRPAFLGFTAFVISFVILGELLGPTTCADGWRSRFIGRSGARSHHGGVDRDKPSVRFLGSLTIALLVWGGIARPTNSEPTGADGGLIAPMGGFDRSARPGEVGPYGSVEKHREVLVASGADPKDVDELMRQLYGAQGS